MVPQKHAKDTFNSLNEGTLMRLGMDEKTENWGKINKYNKKTNTSFLK